MKNLIKLIIILLCIGLAAPAFAEVEQPVQCFFETGNVKTASQRLQNQYNIESPVVWNDASANGQAEFKESWPHSLGQWSTNFEVDEETGDIYFNLLLTAEQADSLPSQDTPNFTKTCDNEVDGEGGSTFVLPTYKVKEYDEEGVWLGTYYDRAVTVMQ